ncbi:abortive infection family protein [Duganella sp. sic0402]|uniref:abortive infection family protein n=1 Tax=Duganella sp. sic0402 TaxID=2854786 RepID=UPI001C492BC9|nr:abortive infection family protein [Duganella sp. sic0402]MBV7539367.1 abortive infection family protein [Duganella sp. sic0402]
MSTPLDRLRQKTEALKSKRGALTTHLFDLERNLAEIFDGLDIRAHTPDVTLEEYAFDESTYGYLSFSDSTLRVAYRSTEQDRQESFNGVPEEEQEYSLCPLAKTSPEWLEKLAIPENIAILTSRLELALDSLIASTDVSISGLTKVFEFQTIQVHTDAVETLQSFDSNLVKAWKDAHDKITVDPAESITKSSSYVESICKHILAGLGIPMPAKQVMTSLIGECEKALGLSEDEEADQDLKSVVGGIKSICQGIGALRTHFGTAHGKEPGAYIINEHYARLINTSAAAVSAFLVQRYHTKRLNGGSLGAVAPASPT